MHDGGVHSRRGWAEGGGRYTGGALITRVPALRIPTLQAPHPPTSVSFLAMRVTL